MHQTHKIAIVVPGGIGTGRFLEGVPCITSYVNEIANKSNVVVFSLFPIDQGFQAANYKVVHPSKERSLIGKFIWLITCFIQYHRNQKFDLIHAFWGFPVGVYCCFIKMLLAIPLVVHLQGGDSVYLRDIDYGQFGNRFKSWLLKWTYSKADELVVLTTYQKNELKKHFNGRVPVVIPFGPELSLFQPRTKKLTSEYRFIHMAHINHVKDQKVLLNAFSGLLKQIEATLYILGEDTLNGELQSYAKRLGIYERVHFCGVLPHREALTHLEMSDILIHTSRYEAQAVVVTEALASGVPVCGTHVGLLADLSQKCTLSSQVGQSDELVENVMKLIMDPTDYQKQIDNGLEWVKSHDVTWTADEFFKVYDRITRE